MSMVPDQADEILLPNGQKLFNMIICEWTEIMLTKHELTTNSLSITDIYQADEILLPIGAKTF